MWFEWQFSQFSQGCFRCLGDKLIRYIQWIPYDCGSQSVECESPATSKTLSGDPWGQNTFILILRHYGWPSNNMGVNCIGPLVSRFFFFSWHSKFKPGCSRINSGFGSPQMKRLTIAIDGFLTAQEVTTPNPQLFKGQLYFPFSLCWQLHWLYKSSHELNYCHLSMNQPVAINCTRNITFFTTTYLLGKKVGFP